MPRNPEQRPITPPVTQEVPILDQAENYPSDAIELLKDGLFHEVFSGPRHMNRGDSEPLTFWVNGYGGRNLEPTEYPTVAPGYRLVFHRDPESWMREGGALGCRGTIQIGEKTMRVAFTACETGQFFEADFERAKSP